MAKIDTITVTMHRFLVRAAARADGAVKGDNGVRRAMVRRGLAVLKGKDLVISELGRCAIDHAPLNDKSCPTSMDLGEFQEYLRTRGKA